MEVKLKEFGLDLIEVSDNGSGVSPSNYEGIALKYHTSKLSTFSDLTAVTSFGFRGEALSSLCELAGSFSVTTRTSGESVGVRLTYSRDGKLVGKVSLFSTSGRVPVRARLSFMHPCDVPPQFIDGVYEHLHLVFMNLDPRRSSASRKLVRCYLSNSHSVFDANVSPLPLTKRWREMCSPPLEKN